MGIVFENSLHVSPENLIVIDYLKTEKPHTMPLMHYHPYYEIYILLSGKRKYLFNNKIVVLNPYDVLIVKPYEVHRAIPLENIPYERYIINLDPSLLSQIEKYNKEIKKLFKRGVIRLEGDDFLRIINNIKSIEKDIKNGKKEFACSIRNYLERILVDMLIFDSQYSNSEQIQKNDIRIQEVLDYIIINYKEKITIDICANICSMSKTNFTRVFHKVVGTNLKEYINSVRIQKASDLLLETDLSISEISEKVGFDSASYFSAVFKSKLNITPKEFRKK